MKKITYAFVLTLLLCQSTFAGDYVCPLVVGLESEILIDPNTGLPVLSPGYIVVTEIRVTNLSDEANPVICEFRNAAGKTTETVSKTIGPRATWRLLPEMNANAGSVVLQTVSPVSAVSILRNYLPQWHAFVVAGICKFDPVEGEEFRPVGPAGRQDTGRRGR